MSVIILILAAIGGCSVLASGGLLMLVLRETDEIDKK